MAVSWTPTWLSRIEDAGLNASAPPQQRWMDGWLVRFSPGKARRARCINAVATGRLRWEEKLQLAATFYAECKLPLAVRITPFTLPAELDAGMALAGYAAVDLTHVMACPALKALPAANGAPTGYRYESLPAGAFADAVGALRGSSIEQRCAHAERLLHAPVPSQRYVLRRESDAAIVACGQATQEGELVGLYDIHTQDDVRGAGLATWVCEQLLSNAARHGARIGYLQVDAANVVARRIYARFGFTDVYSYHYRQLA